MWGSGQSGGFGQARVRAQNASFTRCSFGLEGEGRVIDQGEDCLGLQRASFERWWTMWTRLTASGCGRAERFFDYMRGSDRILVFGQAWVRAHNATFNTCSCGGERKGLVSQEVWSVWVCSVT